MGDRQNKAKWIREEEIEKKAKRNKEIFLKPGTNLYFLKTKFCDASWDSLFGGMETPVCICS
jgi:hypothetical protein